MDRDAWETGPEDETNPHFDPENDRVEGDAKPPVQLSGENGNVFNIIARVSRALKDAGQKDAATTFRERAFAAGSYDAVLQLCFEYCEVS